MLGVEVRNVEMKITAADDMIISAAGASGSDPQQCRLPTSMKLVKEIKIDYPRRVCHYKGYTYVTSGLRDLAQSIDRLDGHGDIAKGFMNFELFVVGFIAHDDRLYTALRKLNQTNVAVYELSGKKVLSWRHSDEDIFSFIVSCKALTVFRDQLVTADVNKFTLYALTGERLRVVDCNKIGATKVSLCHAGGDSIIVTNGDALPAMLKFNLATAAVEWTSNVVKEPSAVTMLNKEYALVTEYQSSDHVKLFIINQITGEKRFPRLLL